MSIQDPRALSYDAAAFERDVIEPSKKHPVIVDFWAEWCQPCRVLGPVLEKLAEEYAGKVSLVKIETERAPEIAAGLRVRSIPAVFGFRDGKVIDSFVGLLPENAIRSWIDSLFPSPSESLLSEAAQLEASDPLSAEAKYREAIALDAANLSAKLALARLLMARGALDEARALVDGFTSRELLEPESERLKTALSLQARARDLGSVEACRQAVEANPKDLRLQLNLATALAAHGEVVEALDICLDLVERNRDGLREPARKTMVDLFRTLDDPDLVSDYQRKLASALF